MTERVEIKLFMTDGLPCLLADKFIQELMKLLPKETEIRYNKVEINEIHELKELSEKYGIDGLPFIIIKRNGEEFRICGFEPEEIEKAVLGRVVITKKSDYLDNVC